MPIEPWPWRVPLRDWTGSVIAFALVDEPDLEHLTSFRWCLNSFGYAVRGVHKEGGGTALRLMHRDILKPSPNEVIDHINGDRLDNRRSNLRVCSQSNNTKNRGKSRNNKTGFKGIYLDALGYYAASITHEGKVYSLGTHKSVEAAARAYDSAAAYFHGEFARLNFPDEIPAPYDQWSHVKPRGKSGYWGVFSHTPNPEKPWRAQIRINGKNKSLGLFSDAAEAARVYDQHARAAFGSRAKLNFPLESMYD